MKQLLFLLLLIPAFANCQDVEYKIEGYVGGKNIKELPGKYLSIETTVGFNHGNRFRFTVYYGQKSGMTDEKDFKLTDKDGNQLIFTSMVAVYNFMNENGYDLVETSLASTDKSFLFRKRT